MINIILFFSALISEWSAKADVQIKSKTIELFVDEPRSKDWKIKVFSRNSRLCQLDYQRTGSKSKISKLSEDDCQELWETLSNIESSLTELVGTNSNLFENSYHQAKYKFSMNKKTFPVEFKAHGECSINREGLTECKVNDLTNAQYLLLALRQMAHSMERP